MHCGQITFVYLPVISRNFSKDLSQIYYCNSVLKRQSLMFIRIGLHKAYFIYSFALVYNACKYLGLYSTE
jgi:hypothetical protein